MSCPRADGTVQVDVDGGRRLTLDQFACRVWTSLTDRPTLADLMVRLREDGAATERLAEEITRLLARWRAIGVITWL